MAGASHIIPVMSQRIIHLRRPPVISLADEEPFVPEGHHLDEVERRWSALRARNPAYFDGRTYHVLGVHRNGCGGAIIHVKECAYRFRAAQDDEFDLGARSLGVKAFTTHDDQLLLGKRSDRVARYNGMWEFAPGGVIEPGREPVDVITSELREEAGLEPAADPVPIAILDDDELRCWEIVYRMRARDHFAKPSDEYADLRWCTRTDLPRPLSPIAELMRQLL